jgi:hypothetical protein
VTVFLKVTNTHLYIIQKKTNQKNSYHMVPYVNAHQKITKHMATHVITHKILEKKTKHVVHINMWKSMHH